MDAALTTIDARTGNFLINSLALGRVSALDPERISISPRFCPDRREVERFINETYAHAYGSVITTHYPTIMSAQNREEEILAAVGFRDAATEPLFLENYLDRPVEQALSDALRQPVARSSIVEIGNLASAGNGASALLFVALASHLRDMGYRYAVVTATSVLRRSFRMMGFLPMALAKADQTRLADAGAQWGSYYDRDPEVVAGAIAPWADRLLNVMPRQETGAFAADRPIIHNGLLERVA